VNSEVLPSARPQRRRTLLIVGGLAALGVGGATTYVIANADHAIANPGFADLRSALATLDQLRTEPLYATTGWDLPHVLHHSAQSIDYSIDGYPQPKPAWFRHTMGPTAFAMFSARGRMSHGLTEPIPGAPDIAQGLALGPAVERVMQSLLRFDRHGGPLAPHFAFGALSKPEFMRAHLMHLANHWDVVDSL
jgi:hypothetical protein